MWPFRKNRKLLFKFHDGDRWRRVDPVSAYLGLHSHPEFRIDQHPKLIESEVSEVSLEATNITVQAVRDVFGLQSYDEKTGKGTPVAETLDVLYDFFGFIENLKKNTSPTPTAPLSTAATSPASSAATTSATPPSGSSKNGNLSGRPTPSGAA